MGLPVADSGGRGGGGIGLPDDDSGGVGWACARDAGSRAWSPWGFGLGCAGGTGCAGGAGGACAGDSCAGDTCDPGATGAAPVVGAAGRSVAATSSRRAGRGGCSPPLDTTTRLWASAGRAGSAAAASPCGTPATLGVSQASGTVASGPVAPDPATSGPEASAVGDSAATSIAPVASEAGPSVDTCTSGSAGASGTTVTGWSSATRSVTALSDAGLSVTGFLAGAFLAVAFFAGAFLAGLDGSSGCWSRLSPSRSALRRTRSAWASCTPEEWLLTPIPSDSHRSRHSLLVSPSSLASS